MTKAQSDQLKAVLLVAGVVVVFGFIYLQVTGANKPIVPVQTEPVAVMSAGTQAAVAEPQADLIVLNDDQAAIEFNPFRKVVKPVAAPVTSGGVGGPSSVSGGMTVIPSGDLNPLSPQVDITALDRESLAKLPLEVEGVITGDKPVAVVRIGSESYIMGLGDPVGEGVVIADINESYVVFRKGKSVRSVRVGDSKMLALLIPYLQARVNLF